MKRIVTIFHTVLISVLILGCASRYELSDNALQLTDSMSKEEALSIIAHALSGWENGSGLCNAHTNRNDQPAQFVEVVDQTVMYRSLETVFVGSSLQQGGAGATGVTAYYGKQAKSFSLHLDNVNKTRVTAGLNYPNCPQNEVVIQLYEGVANSIKVHLDKENEDKFMAAIKLISPDVRLMSGVGL